MRESPQALNFKELLPEELKKNATVSMSYQHNWRIIASHLKTLYGKYADPAYCLSVYYSSDEYRKNRQIIKRCPDLSLIDEADIKRMILEEEEYNHNVQKILNLYHNREEYDAFIEMASLLGIYPDNNPNPLYKWIVAKHMIPDDEWIQIRANVDANMNLLSVVTYMLAKTYIGGYLLEFPVAGCVMTQQRGKYYYRGENAYYRSSKASYYRTLDNSLSPLLQAIIGRLRLYQCCDMLDKFNAVRGWNACEINYMALAQHYGFRTQMLDITSNLKTAIFFACCKYGQDKKWHPLSQDDFLHRNSRMHISKTCNGDSRYGVLYRSPSEITDVQWAIEKTDSAYEIIIPVGYQPFMRCSSQHGYMLLTRTDNYDLFNDAKFDKFKFRLSERLCNWIFEEMDCGNTIYPIEDIPDISEEMNKVNFQMSFSTSVFEATMENFRLYDENRDMVKKCLEELGISIQDNVEIIDALRLEGINNNYSAELAMKRIGVNPVMSPLVTLWGSAPQTK